MANAFVMFGTMAAFAGAIALLDWLGQRQLRKREAQHLKDFRGTARPHRS